jgi:hypothetical protein
VSERPDDPKATADISQQLPSVVPPAEVAGVIGKVAPEIPQEKRESIAKEVITVAHRMMQFQGPVPPPQMLAEYEKVLPGSADRLIRLTERQLTLQENQSAHRISMEAAVHMDRA